MGEDRVRWPYRSSKPACPCKWIGGFDSHPLPPFYSKTHNYLYIGEVREPRQQCVGFRFYSGIGKW